MLGFTEFLENPVKPTSNKLIGITTKLLSTLMKLMMMMMMMMMMMVMVMVMVMMMLRLTTMLRVVRMMISR